jgi:hypothetical protein
VLLHVFQAQVEQYAALLQEAIHRVSIWVASLSPASWNHIASWLRQLDALRKVPERLQVQA